MSRGKGDAGAYMFTRAAYDEVRDSELQHAVHYDVRLETGYQKGIWVCRISAQGLLDGDGGRLLARWEGTWPNSTATAFEGFLYAAVHRVARMVEEVRYNQGREGAGRENRR
jgi:hypothetical protein